MNLLKKITHLIGALLQLVVFISSQSEANSHDVIGHGEELGKHRPPEGHIEIQYELPTSREFWERFASKRTPALFRGTGKHFPAFSLWTDEYMVENFGDLKIKIEGKTEKDHYPEGALGVAQDTLRHFLDTYRAENKYVVSQLPDRLAEDVLVPPFLNCGTFRERLLEANLWLSSGGTKSLLHRDADNAINCLLNGTKDWVMIDPIYEDLIPIAKEDVDAYGGFSLLNPDSVDLERYPMFREVPWTYANMTAGDCLFLPYGYWHQVRSYGDKNLAVSMLFSRLKEVDLEECEAGPPPDFIPLSESQMVFHYDGYGDQSMGNTDPFELKEMLVDLCENEGSLHEENIRGTLLQNYNDFDTKVVQPVDLDQEILEETVKKLMSVLDIKGTGRVPCDTMRALRLDTLTLLADIIDNDPANTEGYEYAKFDPDDIRRLIQRLLSDAERTSGGFITMDAFIQGYKSIGGSDKIAREVFGFLSSNDGARLTREDISQNLSPVLEKFKKKMKVEITAALEWNKAVHEHSKPWQTEDDRQGEEGAGRHSVPAENGGPIGRQVMDNMASGSESEETKKSPEHVHDDL